MQISTSVLIILLAGSALGKRTAASVRADSIFKPETSTSKVPDDFRQEILKKDFHETGSTDEDPQDVEAEEEEVEPVETGNEGDADAADSDTNDPDYVPSHGEDDDGEEEPEDDDGSDGDDDAEEDDDDNGDDVNDVDPSDQEAADTAPEEVKPDDSANEESEAETDDGTEVLSGAASDSEGETEQRSSKKMDSEQEADQDEGIEDDSIIDTSNEDITDVEEVVETDDDVEVNEIPTKVTVPSDTRTSDDEGEEEVNEAAEKVQPPRKVVGSPQAQEYALGEDEFEEILPGEDIFDIAQAAEIVASKGKEPSTSEPSGDEDENELDTFPEEEEETSDLEDEIEEELGMLSQEKNFSNTAASRKVHAGLGYIHGKGKTALPQDSTPVGREVKESPLIVLPDEALHVTLGFPSFVDSLCRSYVEAISADSAHHLDERLTEDLKRLSEPICLIPTFHFAASQRRLHCLPLLLKHHLQQFQPSQLTMLKGLLTAPMMPAFLLDQYMTHVELNQTERRGLIKSSFQNMSPSQFLEAIDYWLYTAGENIPENALSAGQKEHLNIYQALDKGAPLPSHLPPLSAATVSALIRAAQLGNPSRSKTQPNNMTRLLETVPDKAKALKHGHRNILDLWMLTDPKAASSFLEKHGQELLGDPFLPLESFLAILKYCPTKWYSNSTFLANATLTFEAQFALKLQRSLSTTKPITNICSNPSSKKFDLAPFLPESEFQEMTATTQGIILAHLIYAIFDIHPDLQMYQQGLRRSNMELFEILLKYCEHNPSIEISNTSTDSTDH